MQTTNNEEENRRRERIQDGIRYTGSLFDTRKQQAPQKIERSDAPAIIRKATENNTNPCYYLQDLTTRIDSIIKQHDQDFEQAFAEKRINLSPDPALAEYTKKLALYFDEVCAITKILLVQTLKNHNQHSNI